MCSPLRQCVVPHALASDAKIPRLRASDSSAESARARASHGFMIGERAEVEQTPKASGGNRDRARSHSSVTSSASTARAHYARRPERALSSAILLEWREVVARSIGEESRGARHRCDDRTRSWIGNERPARVSARDGNRVSGSATRVGQGGAGCTSSQRAHDLERSGDEERDWPRSIGSAHRGGSVLISGSLGVTEQRRERRALRARKGLLAQPAGCDARDSPAAVDATLEKIGVRLPPQDSGRLRSRLSPPRATGSRINSVSTMWRWHSSGRT